MATVEPPILILLPGPVPVSAEVYEAFSAAPVSHRSQPFIHALCEARESLCRLAQAQAVEVLVGTGTLANDVIAAQLSLQNSPGLILSSGEFGERLFDHADRFGLSYQPLRTRWGTVLQEASIRQAIEAGPVSWLWAVHCETSTGVLNDLDMLKAVCGEYGIRLCLDCISSIGTTPLDLSGVYLASASSNKGLGAYPGLAIVFYQPPITPASRQLPRYLDLGLYAASEGTPFTHSSNLVAALNAALGSIDEQSYILNQEVSAWLREELAAAGFDVVAPAGSSSPAVMTLALPTVVNSVEVGESLDRQGYWLSYRSDYLIQRNWIQICTMTACSMEQIRPLPTLLRRECFGS